MKRILLLAILMSAPLFALTEDQHLAILAEKTQAAANNYFGLGSQIQFEKLNASFGVATQYVAVFRPTAGGYDITLTVNQEPSNSYELSNGFNVNGFIVKTNSGTWYGTAPKGLYYCPNPTNQYSKYPVYFDIPVPITLNVTNFSRALTQACLDYQAAVNAAPTATPTAQPTANLPNPASVNCVSKNGTLEIRDEAGGQVGYCTLPGGVVCEEWALYRGECPATPTPTPTAVPTVAPTVAPTIAPTATPTPAAQGGVVIDTNLLLVVLLVVVLGAIWWYSQKKKR
ncbi:Uncharacterised protein [Candidatus Norongarragalina meridionalis]|nr:Uncharacterised protein [Candidatus Norongarragalina meridionalis]